MKYRLYYCGLRVRDLDRSLRFYTKVLGMRVVASGTMPHGGKYLHLRTPGSAPRLELNWYPNGSRFYTPYRRGDELDHLAFVVPDGKAAVEGREGHGGLRRGSRWRLDRAPPLTPDAAKLHVASDAVGSGPWSCAPRAGSP